ncbi:hypothetical protein COUCH_35980 [Couchioplanes caeruleus]|uniref:hypothetical protein n=1 Tax=Couchioplanes caeruleus TaxID=56438 RepID=UPI0020C0F674|nr:hypothetical protein [Couchioplanes caeruleus]UQU64300.1 hypothetical protein COUCH_35980 [Couchioplanes caeruleus]
MITDEDLLAYRDLTPPGERGGTAGEGGVTSGVRCGRPLLYPVPAEDLPLPLRRRAQAFDGRYVGALFAYDLDELPPGRRYLSARFDVTLDERSARAVHLAVDGDDLGLVSGPTAMEPASATAAHTVAAARKRSTWLRRLTGRSGTPRAWPTGVQSPDFGWAYDDPAGDLLLPRAYAMHALLEVPAATIRVTGRLGVRVDIGVRGGRQPAGMSESVRFDEPLTAAGVPRGAAVRLCMAADVSGYSRRGNDATERIQRDLVATLARCRRAAGIPDTVVTPQPQGDGQFTVLPVGIDESAVIPALLHELHRALGELNDGADPADRMRLRVAFHRGLIKEGDNGWIGAAPIAVHRFLDSPPLRRALADHDEADFVLGVPDVLFRDVIVPAAAPPRPEDFVPMVVDLPEKGFVEHGWLHVGPA